MHVYCTMCTVSVVCWYLLLDLVIRKHEMLCYFLVNENETNVYVQHYGNKCESIFTYEVNDPWYFLHALVHAPAGTRMSTNDRGFPISRLQPRFHDSFLSCMTTTVTVAHMFK